MAKFKSLRFSSLAGKPRRRSVSIELRNNVIARSEATRQSGDMQEVATPAAPVRNDQREFSSAHQTLQWRALCAVMLCLFLAACQSIPSPTASLEGLDWPARKAYLKNHRDFGAKGRVGVIAGKHSEQGDFRIENSGREYVARMSGPFGIGAVTFEGNEKQVLMNSSKHQNIVIRDPVNELENYLGYPIPLSAMSYWLVGIPAPGAAAQEGLSRDAPRLETLGQAGWRVNYLEYRDFNGLELPRKVDLLGPNVRIRIVFRSWQFPLKGATVK